jgi:diketogulonate reductase-like aldo/keto reductase
MLTHTHTRTHTQVIKVAKAHGVSGAQVALKWIVQQNISAVTAAHNPAYIAEDIDLWSWGDLTEGEMAALAAI